MSQGYTLRLRDLNDKANASNVGVRLGRVCIERGISVTSVSQKIGVTRATVYNWFCGATAPQGHAALRIEAFLAELK